MAEEFKLIVAGGRDFTQYIRVSNDLNSLANKELAAFDVSIVGGLAKGADAQGKMFAEINRVKFYGFPADWNKHGKAAGILRNHEMGDFADGLLAYWDGESRGTKDMIDYMRSLNKAVRVVRYRAIPSFMEDGTPYTKFEYPEDV